MIDKIFSLYRSGLNVNQIAARLFVSKDNVEKVLQNKDIEINNCGCK